jgi:hypothetical protein
MKAIAAIAAFALFLCVAFGDRFFDLIVCSCLRTPSAPLSQLHKA